MKKRISVFIVLFVSIDIFKAENLSNKKKCTYWHFKAVYYFYYFEIVFTTLVKMKHYGSKHRPHIELLFDYCLSNNRLPENLNEIITDFIINKYTLCR